MLEQSGNVKQSDGPKERRPIQPATDLDCVAETRFGVHRQDSRWLDARHCLLALIASLSITSNVGAHAPAVVITGVGTAVVDGATSSGEWQSAGCREFAVNVPEGGTTPGIVCAMNDDANIYLLVRFRRQIADPGNSGVIEFDNDHDGIREDGDDVLLINPDIGFFDELRSTAPPCPAGALCGFFDTALGGTNDGTGAFGNDGTFTTYEFLHPLDSSDDPHDFSIGPGSVVGFDVSVRLIGAGQQIADTDFPQGMFGDLVIASRIASVEVDIKPGSTQNHINRRSHGKIPVAIMSTGDFDASTQLNAASLTFGATGNEPSLAFCHAADVNGDRRKDLMCHFNTQAAGFRAGDTQGVLKGLTITGVPIEGTDSVRIVR